MIVLAIFRVVATVIGWLLGQFPTFTPPDLTSALTAIGDSRIWNYIAWANWYTPVDLALSLASIRVAFGVALFGWEFLSWVGTKLHIFGGSR